MEFIHQSPERIEFVGQYVAALMTLNGRAGEPETQQVASLAPHLTA